MKAKWGGGGWGGGVEEHEIFLFLKGETEVLVTFVGEGGTVHFYKSQSNSRSPMVVKNDTSLTILLTRSCQFQIMPRLVPACRYYS